MTASARQESPRTLWAHEPLKRNALHLGFAPHRGVEGKGAATTWSGDGGA